MTLQTASRDKYGPFWTIVLTIVLLLTTQCSESISVRSASALTLTSAFDSNSDEQTVISEIVDYLKRGDDEIKLDDKYRNLILALGYTGSGKSTFVQWISGRDGELFARKVSKGQYTIEGKGIGSGADSVTLFPEQVLDTSGDPNLVYYDCPGFGDSRNSSVEIAGTYFIKRVTEHARQIKLLFLIGYPAFQVGIDRTDLIRLFRHATSLIKNVDKYAGSIAMVVSKVDNIYDEGKVVSDGEMIEDIGTFLNQTRAWLVGKLGSSDEDEFYRASIKFVDALLTKDGNGIYKAIGIFRKPNQEGPLNTIPILQEGKQRIQEIVKREMKFTNKDDQDFGYTISDKSKIYIQDVVGQINDNLWSEVEKVSEKMKAFYQNATNHVQGKVKVFGTLEPVDANLRESEIVVSNLNKAVEVTTDLVNHVTNATAQVLASKLNATVIIALNIESCRSNVETISNQSSYVHFFQTISDSQLATRPWADLLRNVPANLSASKSLIANEVTSAVDRINRTVNGAINEAASEVEQVYLNRFQSIEISALPSNLEESHRILTELTQKIDTNRVIRPGDLAQWIDDTFKGLNFSTSKTTTIRAQGKPLEYLQTLTNNPKLNITSSDWIKPFMRVANFLLDSSKWYRFVYDLYGKLSQYEIQRDPTKYNVENLEDWGQNKNASQGIHITKENFVQFMEKIEPMKVSNWEQVKGIQVTPWQVAELNQVLKITLKHSQQSVHCPGGGVAIVQKDYIKMSNLVQSNGALREDLCSNGVKATDLSEVKVYALHTLFIDENFEASQSQFKLTIVAPKWEIIGNRQLILDGKSGPKLSSDKAADGSLTGNPGSDGIPGLPGGTAGSFFGVGEQFINANQLTIRANGGTSGSGQNGGNGAQGERGGRFELDTDNCIMIFFKYKTKVLKSWESSGGGSGIPITIVTSQILIYGHSGKSGGAGGKGGQWGIGGNAGNITIYQLNSDQPTSIATINKQGNNGNAGQGGSGGPGGPNGNNIWAECYGIGNPISLRKSHHEESSDNGPTGPSGKAGDNSAGIQQPSPVSQIDRARRINEFKSYLRDNINDRFKRGGLMHFLDQLERDDKITSVYDTFALIDDMNQLENQFRKFATPTTEQPQQRSDLITFYSALLPRIANYTNATIATESNQNKKALTILYTAALGRLNYLKFDPEANLIIDVKSYFEMVQQNVDSLNKLREKHNQLVVINKYRNDYQNNIKQQIKEADYYIESVVKPELDSVTVSIDGQVKLLIDETVELQNKANATLQELKEQREKMKRAIFAGGFMNVLKSLGQVIGLLGPAGQAVGAVMELGGSIGESITQPSIDKLTGNKEPLKLPPSLEANFEQIKNFATGFYEDRIKKLTTKLDTIKKIIDQHPELRDTSLSVEEAREKLAQLLKNPPPSNPNEAVQEIESGLSKVLKEKNDEISKNEKASIKVKKAMKWASNLSKVGGAAVDIANNIIGNQQKMEAIDQAIQEAQENLEKLYQYEQTIYQVIMPTLQTATKDFKEIGDKLGTKSSVALDVTQWLVQGRLRDLILQMHQMTEGFSVEASLTRCIEKLDEAMTILIKLYDRIQDFQHQQNLANFIADINSAAAANIAISDPALANELDKLEILIRSNVVLQQYEASIAALKQLVFPYAHLYLQDVAKSTAVNLTTATTTTSDLTPITLSFSSAQNIDTLVTNAIGKIEQIRNKLKSYESSIWSIDKYTHTASFYPTNACTRPFYVWPNRNHHSAIARLLAGETIVVKADVTRSAPNMDSIKFNMIEINLRAENESVQSELNRVLESFAVNATHLGNSYYRYDGKFYVISSEYQYMYYTFLKDHEGNPVDMNNVYRKLKAGDIMLSPYAMWQIRLISSSSSNAYERLAPYVDLVELQLVGKGSYIELGGGALNHDLHLDHYYQSHDTIKADPNKVNAQENALQFMNSPKCRQLRLIMSNQNKVNGQITKDNRLFRGNNTNINP